MQIKLFMGQKSDSTITIRHIVTLDDTQSRGTLIEFMEYLYTFVNCAVLAQPNL